MYAPNNRPPSAYDPDPNQRMWNSTAPTPMSSNLSRWANPTPPPPDISYLPGRVINHPDEIMPKEVPMDGSVSVFPLKDLSAIIVKGWNNQGQLVPVTYIPKPPEPQAPSQFESAIFDRLTALEELVKGLQPKAKTKKEEIVSG